MVARRTFLPVAGILVLMAGVQALQMAPAGNIAGQWPLDTLSGATTPDVSGNGNTATLVGGPTSVAGLTGNGIQLNGSSQYLTVPNSASVDPAAGSFSIAVWVRPANTTSAMRVMNKWDGSKGFVFDINTGAGGGASAAAIRARLNDGTNNADFTLAAGIVASTWQHVALVVDRAADVLKFYRDGVQLGTDQNIAALTGNLTTTALVGMGTIPAATGNFFNGILDEPILYKRVLTPAEIQSLATMPPVAPASLTPTNGENQVALAWPIVAGANTYNVLRSQTSGGPYAIIASGIAGLAYTDTTADWPYTYYYVVQAVAGATPGPYSPQAVGTPLPIPVTALPNTGLQTNENGATTLFTITYNNPVPVAGSRVTVLSSNLAEGIVTTAFPGAQATPGGLFIDLTSAAGSPAITVTVTGIDDLTVDPSTAYTVSVTATNMAVTIPSVQLVNNDNDVPGITFSRTSGLSTSENLSSDTFSVTLNTIPYNFIDMDLSSSNLGEAAVVPAKLRFTAAGNSVYTVSGGIGTADWNVAHLVTVTGVDDSVLDFTIPYTIQTTGLTVNHANDSGYTSVPTPDVSGVNIDNEVIPELPTVWGGGSGGGCGLLGLELALVLALARLRRRRAI